MECKKAYDLIYDYVDGRLGASDTDALQRHMGSCEECTEQLRITKSLCASLDDMPLVSVPVGFADAVIDTLKRAGKIVEVPVARAAQSRWFGWLPGRMRIPAAAAALVLVAFVVFPATVGVLQDIVGKGTVLVADTCLEVEDKVSNVGHATRFVNSLTHQFGTLKTVIMAALSLLSTAGQILLVPALMGLLVLTLLAMWYFKSIQKKGAHNASISFV